MSKETAMEIGIGLMVLLGIIAGIASAQALEVKKPTKQPTLTAAKPVAQPALTVSREPIAGGRNYNPQKTVSAYKLQPTTNPQK